MKNIRGIDRLILMAQAMSLSLQIHLPDAIGQILQTHNFTHDGHGGKHRDRGSRMKVLVKMRAQSMAHCPHEGRQEVARRLRQMGGAA